MKAVQCEWLNYAILIQENSFLGEYLWGKNYMKLMWESVITWPWIGGKYPVSGKRKWLKDALKPEESSWQCSLHDRPPATVHPALQAWTVPLPYLAASECHAKKRAACCGRARGARSNETLPGQKRTGLEVLALLEMGAPSAFSVWSWVFYTFSAVVVIAQCSEGFCVVTLELQCT